MMLSNRITDCRRIESFDNSEPLPIEIEMELWETELEPEIYSKSYVFFNSMPNPKLMILQNLYFKAVCLDRRMMMWNVLVVLSQISYKKLGDWACLLVRAATKNKYLDVQELAIRCFENWGSKKACQFLKNSKFEETWLQEYADDVCRDIDSCVEDDEKSVLWERIYGTITLEGFAGPQIQNIIEPYSNENTFFPLFTQDGNNKGTKNQLGDNRHVLPKKDFPWEMAVGKRTSISYSQEYDVGLCAI